MDSNDKRENIRNAIALRQEKNSKTDFTTHLSELAERV